MPTILYLEPKATPTFQAEQFLKEFSRDSLITSKCRLLVKTLDHMDVDRLGDEIDAALATAPDLIVAPASRLALAIRARNPSIPTLFISLAHPAEIGLVSDIARPEGNATGLTYSIQDDLKLFDIARELVGKRASVGLVVDPLFPKLKSGWEVIDASRARLGLQTHVFAVNSADEARQAFDRHRGHVDAWIFMDTTLARYHGREVVRMLRARGGVIVSGRTDLLEAGAHVAVQPVLESPLRTLAEMADLIPRGVPISRIPVARPKRLLVVANVPEMEATPGVAWHTLLHAADRFYRGTDGVQR